MCPRDAQQTVPRYCESLFMEAFIIISDQQKGHGLVILSHVIVMYMYIADIVEKAPSLP